DGHTWTPVDTPMTGLAGSLWSFHLEENGQVGWIAGGLFYPTEKPGYCTNNATGILKDYSFACLYGAVFRTDDGGLTWREQPTTKNIGRFMSIDFVDANHGWVAGDAGVLHTTDGGNTWREDRFKKNCEDYYEMQDIHPTGISFSDQKNGLLMFGSGLVAKSTDGGKTWCGIADLSTAALTDECHTELPGKFRDAAFKDASYGIALDCMGTMFESSDGGATWRKLEEESMQFDSILFHDKANAWVVTRNLELIRVKL
ncbi:MAG TPA: YCF48-related protein, partial [Pyrinomonadaceae bacterium]|nr:YCF48-related protein [Pyrinomonadaceae bacterium]